MDKPAATALTAPASQPMESRAITEVPRAPTSTPVTHTYDNGNVRITSATAHEGSFHGAPMVRNKVTIETGNSADKVHLKSLPDIGVVAEINDRRYLLPIQNAGGMTELVEIKTNGGDDHVQIADDIWFQTTVSLNDQHSVSGINGYTSAPESSGLRTFSQQDIIAIAPHLQKMPNSNTARLLSSFRLTKTRGSLAMGSCKLSPARVMTPFVSVWGQTTH